MCCVCSVCLCLSVCVVFHCQELLNRKLSGMPSAEEATMVTWEELEQAITDGWKGSQMVNKGGGSWGWAVVLEGAPEPHSVLLCGCL